MKTMRTKKDGPIDSNGLGGAGSLSATSSARVAELIRMDIANGVLAPGERIKIAELADRYGISHLPVREALRIVEGDRLVEMSPHKGTTVRPISVKFLEDLYDIRTRLEVYLIERAVERITPEGVERAKKIHARFEKAAARSATVEMTRINREFHNHINLFGDNPEAVRILSNGWELVASVRRRFGYSAERRVQIVAEHARLVELLERRDKQQAVEVLTSHCDNAKLDIIAQTLREQTAEAAAT